jgi:hypothetical protein
MAKIENLIEMGSVAVDSNDKEGLLKFSTEILDLDSKNYHGWFFKAQYFMAIATWGNMQAEGYVSSMKKAFKCVKSEEEKNILISKVISNLNGYMYGLIQQKNSLGGFGTDTTLDSVYINAFSQLVLIKESLNEFIINKNENIVNQLEELLLAYGAVSRKFPFNTIVNNPSVKSLFEQGISSERIQSIGMQNSLSRAGSAIGLVILFILGAIAVVWWIGWGVYW